MKFRVIESSLVAACEESCRFMELVKTMPFAELFSTEGIRTLQQNSKMWPMLTDISRQVLLDGRKHDPETWKHVISAAWRRQTLLRGIQNPLTGEDSGLVCIPMKTRRLSTREFSGLIEVIYAYGGQNAVRWSERALQDYQTYREAA